MEQTQNILFWLNHNMQAPITINIQANVGTSILLSHIHGIQDQNVQTIKVYFFARQYVEFSVIAIGEIK